MEVIQNFTGVWKSQWGNKIKETISIVHCNELYIGMRVCEIVDKEEYIPIETKQTRDYAVALDWYKEWNKDLMNRMLTT